MSKIPAGYKQTEIGVIPEGWSQTSVGQVAPFITSGSRGWAQYYSDIGSSFLRITNLVRGGVSIDLNDLKLVSAPNNAEAIRTQLVPGDVLFSITADIGIIGYIDETIPFPAFINQHIAAIRFDPTKVLPKFVAYYLAGSNAQSYICSLVDQGAKAGVNLPTVAKVPIPLPPLPEQKRIAQILGDMDALIQKLAVLIAKKRDIKQAAMQELLTGKRRLPGFSEPWETKKLGDLFIILAGGDLNNRNFSLVQDKIFKFPVYSNSLSSFGLYGFTSIANYPAESITVTARGTIGHAEYRSTQFDAIGRVLVLIGKQENAPVFFASFINERLVFASESTGVPQLTAPQISGYEVLSPPLSEQNAIAKILSDMESELVQLETRLGKTRDLKTGLMQQLLTGKIRLGEKAV